MPLGSIAPERSPYRLTRVGKVAFTVGTEATDVVTVAMQVKDQGLINNQATRTSFRLWLASDANGTPSTPVPTGGVAAVTYGSILPVSYNPADALLAVGTLAVHSTPEQFKTTTIANYLVAGVPKTKAATTGLTFTAAHTVTASKFGVILVQINAAGTVSTKVPSATQAYNSAPLALAALPAADAGNVALGYIAIANNAGDWVANTDDLTNGSDLTTAAFVDATPTSIAPRAWDALTDASGRVSVTVTESGTATFYLAARLPDGSVNVSGPLTFAA